MKASETRELIEISISMAFGNTKRDNKKLHELCQLAHVELDELERLAEIGRAAENIRRKQVDNESNSNHIRNRNGYPCTHRWR